MRSHPSLVRPPSGGSLPYRRHRRFGGRLGGLRGVLFRHAGGHQERDGVRPRATPGAGPQKHSVRAGQALHPDAGLRSRRRDDGAAPLRLHHPAQPGHGASERHPALAGAECAARPAPADRLFLPFPGRGPARKGHRHRALRHRQRRHSGRPGDQGRGRHGDGPEPRIHRIRRHAEHARSPPAWWTLSCRRPRCRPGSFPMSSMLSEKSPAESPLRPPSGRRLDAKDIHPAPQPDRARLFGLQAKHHFPAHRAAHGRPPDRAAGRVRPLSTAKPGGGRGALSRLPDRRHQFFPRPGGLRGARSPSHPAASCRQIRGRRRYGFGPPAVPPERKPIPSRSCSESGWKR